MEHDADWLLTVVVCSLAIAIVLVIDSNHNYFTTLIYIYITHWSVRDYPTWDLGSPGCQSHPPHKLKPAAKVLDPLIAWGTNTGGVFRGISCNFIWLRQTSFTISDMVKLRTRFFTILCSSNFIANPPFWHRKHRKRLPSSSPLRRFTAESVRGSLQRRSALGQAGPHHGTRAAWESTRVLKVWKP